jgi:NAD+ kinase
MPPSPRQVGLLTALHKPQARERCRALAQALRAAGAEVLVDDRLADLDLEGCTACPAQEWGRRSDLVIAMGGDGTLLAAARATAPGGIPVLGVDLGGFGFLAEQEFDHVLEAIPVLLAGEFEIEERLMLSARAVTDGETRAEFSGLNDVVVSKSEPVRLVHLDVWVNESFVTRYPADGLIVCTPTGSTAYNLSAGGPLVDPQVECFILTPICAHSLYTRPLVVPAAAQVRLALARDTKPSPPVTLTVDGQVHRVVGPGEQIVITAAPFRARLARLRGVGFYGRLQEKLHWGAQR